MIDVINYIYTYAIWPFLAVVFLAYFALAVIPSWTRWRRRK